jgi:hypothetical protein
MDGPVDAELEWIGRHHALWSVLYLIEDVHRRWDVDVESGYLG